MVLTRSAMSSFSREELEDYTASQDSNILAKLTKSENDLVQSNTKLVRLESELAISKQVNDVLSKRMVEVERISYSNEQYSRRECIEISGIPATFNDVVLKEKVCSILKMIDINVSPDNGIKACHRMSKKKQKRNSEIFSAKRLVQGANVQEEAS